MDEPAEEVRNAVGNGTRVQRNDESANVDGVTDYVAEERRRMSPEDARAMSVSIKADRVTQMGTMSDVRQALRRAGALRVNYSATQKGKK